MMQLNTGNQSYNCHSIYLFIFFLGGGEVAESKASLSEAIYFTAKVLHTIQGHLKSGFNIGSLDYPVVEIRKERR